MNLNALRLFVSVVQDGSLSKTAERLSVPIATISRQIVDLEKSLKIQLFDRQKTGVKPTVAGQKLYEQVYQSMDNLLQVEQAFGESSDELSGKLRISTSAGAEKIWGWIDEFCALYPQVSVNLQVTDRLLDLVEDGIDFAFRSGDLHTDNVVAKRVMTARAKWLAHPDLLARFGRPQSPADLVKFPLVAWTKGDQKTAQIPMGKKILSLPYAFASNDMYAIIYAIKSGRGLGLLDENFANRLIQENGLIEVLPDHPMDDYPVHLIYLRHRHQSAVMRAFLDFIDSKVAGAL
ncbi:transcriptional regulator [Pasteurellaceae bacterium RH1A]|nr:transcriptional regulator [Pasteurellaceae bacterium RH1A]